MIVYIPSPLRSYTGNKGQVDVDAPTLQELSNQLDKHYPGIKFRMIDEQEQIRQHIKIFVNKQEVHTLALPLTKSDVVQIVCALSGG